MSALPPGVAVPHSQTGTGAGTVAYRKRIIGARPGRVVWTTENTTTIQATPVPLFSPGELQILTVTNRQFGYGWTYTHRPKG